MKRISKLLAICMASLMLASCSETISYEISPDSTIKAQITFSLTNEELVLYTGGSKEENVKQLIDYQSDEFFGSNNTDITYEKTDSGYDITATCNDNINNKDLFQFDCYKCTTNSFIGSAKNVINMNELSSNITNEEFGYEVSLSFGEAITVTNGTLSNDNKTVTFTKDQLANYVYAATASATDSWATATDVDVAAKEFVNSCINVLVQTTTCKLTSRTTALVKWPTLKNATSYNVYMKKGSNKWTKVANTTSRSYTANNLVAGYNYFFKVRGLNENWSSNCTLYDYVYVMKSTAKAQINSLKKSGTKAIIKAKYLKGASGFAVYMSSKSSSKGFKRIGYTKYRKLVKSNLTKGKTYYFKLRAFQTINSKKHFGQYSKVKKVKI